MKEFTNFDDTYTGLRWTYGLQFRPPTASNLPTGWIIFSDREHSKFNHGTIQYPRALTPDEIKSYQLELVE